MRVKTCLRFPGGKFYALKKIRSFHEIPHEEFREVFVGGGSILFDKQLAPNLNWINDIDQELINFYRIIQNPDTKNKLYKLLEGNVVNKERYAQIRSMKPKNKIERAFKYFYLNRTSFSGIMNKPRWGYRLGSSVTPDRWVGRIEPVANKLKGVKITNLDFRKVITAKSNNHKVLMYLDPPYFKASKSIYVHEFKLKDHLDLQDLLKETKYNFVLSYENQKEIKDMYSWANIYEIDFTYFMSEARRQEGKELIITNFETHKSLFSKNINV